ncbi:uncharacterized protein [Apostichopus japonicus]|uniref:uncharacterized protein isoform X3 n=1 Tax=Stichopus japonicus TaxID=307972 RepID=UPI003AB7197F
MAALAVGNPTLEAQDSVNESLALQVFTEPEDDSALIGEALKDRGDSPAQVVLDKTLKAQADRRAEETKYELNKIQARVDQTMAAFELNEQLLEDNKAAYFVPDLLELEKVIGDAIQKRKYQQHVMIFVVSFEEATEQKLKLLNQINDFFTIYINNIDEKDLQPKAAEVDLEEVSISVQEALATADMATQKLSEINQEIVTYVEKLHSGKALTKSKKKLEKALLQAKDDIMGLTEKLMGAQAEIEDKEDQMTKLYKQIDLKNLETMKYKNVAENAKKKLEQIDDLNLEIKERDEEIERLNKAAFDQELSIKQMEQSKEKSYAKLKGAHEESELNIQKLQSKVQNLQLLLEDTKADLQKQHRIQVEELKQAHEEEITDLTTELQKKIDHLESEALNQERGWASDSEEEGEIISSPHSSSRQTQSRKSVRDPEVESKMSEASVAASGRMSKDSGKASDDGSTVIEDQLSRQSTRVSQEKSVKPSPPDTPKRGRKDDLDPGTPKTPKRLVRNKSNLEPVHEVPYEGKVTLEDEDKWTGIPPETLPSAFKQYRKEALLVVHGLQNQLKVQEDDHHKKVKQLREHMKDKDDGFQKEKSSLLKQVDVAMLLKEAAEKEADDALAQLESFVTEHGQLADVAETEKKELKKLTPEQREKFLEKKVTKKTKDEKKSSKKGKTTSKKQTSNKSKENVGEKNEYENEGESPDKNDQSKESINNEEKSPIKEVTHDAKDNVDNPDDEQLAEAYEAALNLDKEAKECVDRGQQTSRPESEAKSTATSSVVKKPLLDPNEKRQSKMKQRKKKSLHQKTKPSDKLQNIENKVNKKTVDIRDVRDGTVGIDSVDGMSLSRGGGDPKTRSSGTDQDRIEEEVIAQHLERILDSAQWSDGDDEGAEGDDEEDEDRPSSALSQRSLYEKFKAQLEQKKLEVIERRSRATSMHGSLLSGQEEPHPVGSSRGSSAITTASADMGLADERGVAFPKSRTPSVTVNRLGSHLVSRAPSVSESGVSMEDEDFEEEAEVSEKGSLTPNQEQVIKTEIGTSPFLMTAESQSSRHSSLSVYDHPIVLDYLKTYDHVKVFKEGLAQAFSEKDLTIASDRLHELKAVEFHKDDPVAQQISVMTANVELFLKEVGMVVSDYLNQEPEATVSSVMTSRLNTGISRLTTAPSLGVHGLAPPPEAPKYAVPTESSPSQPPLDFPESSPDVALRKELETVISGTEPAYRKLQQDYEKLKEDLDLQKQTYEEKMKDNALNVLELEGTIHELQDELAGLGTSPSVKPLSSVTRASSRLEGETDATVIFSRMDTERNQKALKRGINSQKISPDQYNEAVRSMEQYNAVPAKRLLNLVQKYSHHVHMKEIEENVKRSHSIDDEVFSLLEKMEALQNIRAERWGEQMDLLAEERMKLAHLLMESLTKIEEESGIFLIKPILSWKGRGYLPHFQSKLSTYKAPKTFLRPLTRDGSARYGPAPTPTPSQSTIRRVNSRQSEVGGGDATTVIRDTLKSPACRDSPVPVNGSAIQMVGTPPQAMWSMSSSLPADPPKTTLDEDGERMLNKLSSPLITTPKILELEINRMLIGHNTISSPTKPFLSDDRLVNAANASVRSYMTIARPSAYPISNLKHARPNSSGTDNSRIGAGSPLSRSSSPKLHVRAKSESSLNTSQPLPPIKVPTEENDPDQLVKMNGDNEQGHGHSRPVTHPSPPQTPPGSSIRQSPPTLPNVDSHDRLDKNDEDGKSTNGHVTRISMKSPTAVEETRFVE